MPCQPSSPRHAPCCPHAWQCTGGLSVSLAADHARASHSNRDRADCCTAADHRAKPEAARLLGKVRALMRQRRRKARVRAAHAQMAQCCARVSSVVVLVGRRTSKACFHLNRTQRRTRDASIVTAGCSSRCGPVPLAGPALGGRSIVIVVAPCRIACGRPPLVGLAARLGGQSFRGRGATRRVGSTAASAT